MKENTAGWVIYSPAVKFTGPPKLLGWTFAELRKDAIAQMGDAKAWRDLRRKYNFQCVRADRTIKIEL